MLSVTQLVILILSLLNAHYQGRKLKVCIHREHFVIIQNIKININYMKHVNCYEQINKTVGVCYLEKNA